MAKTASAKTLGYRRTGKEAGGLEQREAGGKVGRVCKKARGGGVGPRSRPRRHEMWIGGKIESKELIGLNLHLNGIFLAAEMQT